MTNHTEVDVETAVQAGATGNTALTNKLYKDEPGEYTHPTDVHDTEDHTSTIHSLLLSLPGITVNNYRTVMAKVDSIAALVSLSEVEMRELIGIANAKKLFTFCNQTN